MIAGDFLVQEFGSLWTTFVAKTRPASSQRRGAAFPLREGELYDFKRVFAGLALAQVAEQPLVDMWWYKDV